MSKDKETLKRESVQGCKRVLGLSRLVVTKDEKRLAQAQRNFWETATDEDLTRLKGFYDTVNLVQTEGVDLSSEEYKREINEAARRGTKGIEPRGV